MPWYKIYQNNSEGVFDSEKGEILFIKACDLQEADKAFGTHVLDVDEFPYCPCCGERWPSGIMTDHEVNRLDVSATHKYGRGGWDIRIMDATTGRIMKFQDAEASGMLED